MLFPTAMIMADRSTRQHVRSALPEAPTTSGAAPRPRSGQLRRLTAGALRRMADHVERRHVATQSSTA
jgi:hypothetical protein